MPSKRAPKDKCFQLVIQGWSMYPALQTGDRVTVEDEGKDAPEPGELVVFQKGKKLLCHRLIGQYEEGGKVWVKTKGDALRHEDPPIRMEELLGTVMQVERKGRFWVPSSLPRKRSSRESLIFSFRKGLPERGKKVARSFLLEAQSSFLFRSLYRFLLRPRVTYTILSLPSRYHLLAKVGDKTAGILDLRAISSSHEGEWVLSRLSVRARYRGCRLATTLLRHALQIVRKEGGVRVHVKVPAQKSAPLSFFRKLGFSEGRGVETSSETIRFTKTLPFPEALTRREKGLKPFFYFLFSDHPLFPRLDPGETFKKSFLHHASRQLLLEQALLEIDTLFKKGGVDFLVLKGMALAYLYYPDPATRSMVDIDLFLRKDDVPKAQALLKNIGYRLQEPEYEEACFRFGGELIFYKEGGMPVELHWHLEQYERLKGVLKIEEEALWMKASSYRVSGRHFKTLCAEHHLLYLAIHLGLVHGFEGLKWLLDIDRFVLVGGKTWDWKALFQTAREWRIERLLSLVLKESQSLFNTPLPPLPHKPSPLLKKRACQWLLPDDWMGRWQVLFRIFFPSRAWLTYRYRLRNPKKLPFYRLLHPFFVLSGKTR